MGMDTSSMPAAGRAHDAMDSFVAAIASFCSRIFSRHETTESDVAFSDEWERKQIAREFHLN
jgi:hypothetical protein